MKSIRAQFLSLAVVVLCIALVVSLLPENMPSEINKVQSHNTVTTVYADVDHKRPLNR